MAGSILFIQKTKNFLMSAIISTIEKSGIEVYNSEFDVDVIKNYDDCMQAIFVSFDDGGIDAYKDVIEYVSHLATDKSKKIFLLGDAVSIEAANLSIGEANITKSFLRPVNAKEVSTQVLSHIAGEEKQDKATLKSILVVDDSGTFLHTIKNWLSPFYNVTVVNSANMGMTFLSKNKPDLILLDYEMPVCSGPQMLEMLRADNSLKDIPVMFLTGKGDRESIGQVLELHPQGYMLKTLPKENILESVGNYFKSLE